jgi:hypothetical protein
LNAHDASADFVGQERAVWPSAMQIEQTRALPGLSGAPPSKFSSSESTLSFCSISSFIRCRRASISVLLVLD